MNGLVSESALVRLRFLSRPQGEARLTRFDDAGRKVAVEVLQIVPVVVMPGPSDDPILRKFSARRRTARP